MKINLKSNSIPLNTFKNEGSETRFFELFDGTKSLGLIIIKFDRVIGIDNNLFWENIRLAGDDFLIRPVNVVITEE